MENMNPLTLDQMRNMLQNDGEIIGAAVIISEDGILSYGIIDSRTDDGICASVSACERWLKEKDYGKTWFAYAYHPYHIDRNAWEPCKSCISCDNCEFAIRDFMEQPCYDCCLVGNGSKAFSLFKPVGFCKHCGRPLTEEAWAELENRLSGGTK